MRPTQQLGFAMATAIFIGLITAMSKATAQAYMLFPELGALLGVAITLGLLRLARLTCPPCLGLAILPFVITHPNGAYPWQVPLGWLVWWRWCPPPKPGSRVPVPEN